MGTGWTKSHRVPKGMQTLFISLPLPFPWCPNLCGSGRYVSTEIMVPNSDKQPNKTKLRSLTGYPTEYVCVCVCEDWFRLLIGSVTVDFILSPFFINGLTRC